MRYRLHLATARLRLGQLQAAAGAAEDARRFFQQHDPKGVRLAQAQLVLGEIRFASGAYADSLALADEVLQWLGRGRGIDSTNVDAAFLRARSLVRPGAPPRRCRSSRRSGPGGTRRARPAPAAEVRFWRGRALLLGGDATNGRRLAETALQTLSASPQAADRQLARRLRPSAERPRRPARAMSGLAAEFRLY